MTLTLSEIMPVGVPVIAALASCGFLLGSTTTKLWIVAVIVAAGAGRQWILSSAHRCSFRGVATQLGTIFRAAASPLRSSSQVSETLYECCTNTKLMGAGDPTGEARQRGAVVLRRVAVWLWSGSEPRLSYSCPKGGDWRLELRELCMAFPEVCNVARHVGWRSIQCAQGHLWGCL